MSCKNHFQGQYHTPESPTVLPAVYSEFLFYRSYQQKHGISTDEADKAVTEFLKRK
jgi:hypothetical protein